MTTVLVEKSRAWPKVLAGEIPEEIDVFLLFWVDRTTDRIVDYGSYLSTSEPGPLGTDPLVVCEMTVPVAIQPGSTARTREDLVAAHGVAYELLATRLVHDPTLHQLFERLAHALRDGHCKQKTKVPIEVLSVKDYKDAIAEATRTE